LEVSFTIDGEEIERVTQFWYLGRILEENNDATHVSLRQLARARMKLNCIGKVLQSKGMKPRAMGYFYKAIAKAILLYGSETCWVLSSNSPPASTRNIGAFTPGSEGTSRGAISWQMYLKMQGCRP